MGLGPLLRDCCSSGRMQTLAGECWLPRELPLSLAEGKGEHWAPADYVTQRASFLALCAIFPSDRRAKTWPFLCRLHLAGKTLLPCSCQGIHAPQVVQNGPWFSSITFARCFFLLNPNPVRVPARRGFPSPGAGDAKQQEPLLSAKKSCQVGLLVGQVNVMWVYY